jgi:hypothetical protein
LQTKTYNNPNLRSLLPKATNEEKAENKEHAFNLFLINFGVFFAVFCHKSIGLKAN